MVVQGKFWPPLLAKQEEKHREEILELNEEGWRAEAQTTHILIIVHEILLRNLFETRTPQEAQTDRAADGIQWIRMKEMGKALTDRCQAVQKLSARADDVVLLLYTIKRCLANMLVVLDRSTCQTRTGKSFPLVWMEQEATVAQEPPGLWFTLPELGFPMITNEYNFEDQYTQR